MDMNTMTDLSALNQTVGIIVVICSVLAIAGVIAEILEKRYG